MPTTKKMTTSKTTTPADASVDPAGSNPEVWQPDLLEGYESRVLPLSAAGVVGEPDGSLVATLVRRVGARRERAVLYVHGWNDYFFQTHVAEWFEARGWSFYALDLRRYGRSVRPGQLPGYVADLADYFEDLDAALELIEAEHQGGVLLMGHSTGGLTASLYADARPGRLVGVVLNSPWLDQAGPPALTSVMRTAASTWSRRNPLTIVPMPEAGSDFYARALHADWGGEWNYSRELKSVEPVPIRVGWVRAILKGQQRVARGLAIDAPVFVATSAASWFGRRFSLKARETDIVLDVSRITAMTWRLGRRVTTVRVQGGVHDLFLSRRAVREDLFEQLGLWLDAYVR